MSDGSTSFNIWDLNNISNIANLFLIFVVGSAVPLLRWIWKRNEDRRAAARTAEDARIITTVKAITDPMEKKVESISNTNTEVLKNLNTLVSKFNDFSDQYQEDRILQEKINSKVTYIDSVFQNNIRFSGRDSQSAGQRKRTSGNVDEY